tara:strand:+ start:936 stop:2330 length:1395 start_codon:yes stop_codon:yes gene_type:complete
MAEPEIIDISNLGSNELGMTNDSELKSTNFGPGIELLMNEKKNKPINFEKNEGDIMDLEEELNNLTDNIDNVEYNIPSTKSQSVEFNLSTSQLEPINLGEDLSKNLSDEKTWDGYGKFNDIPMDPDKRVSTQSQLSKEEMLREKFNYLRKLEQLEKRGVELTKKYTIDSNLMEMIGEYEMVMSEKEKQNSVKFQGNMLSALINGIEFLNGRFDPFDIKIDGWSEQFNENINDYDEIFAELHDKYKSSAKMAPELKLVFQLAASGMMVHMSNTMFKSALPGMDDIMRQNPDLMQQFNKAAVDSMGKTNPGFSGFMNNVMNPEPQVSNQGAPPAPIETQQRNLQSRRKTEETEFINRRPDLNASRSGIDIRENSVSADIINRSKTVNVKNTRPEMKGPSDINDLISGLKVKSTSEAKIPVISNDKEEETGSTISISELKELQNESTIPKRSRRRPRSNKNTLSLDI